VCVCVWHMYNRSLLQKSPIKETSIDNTVCRHMYVSVCICASKSYYGHIHKLT